MSIMLFKELTTEEKIQELEAEGIKYKGLFVDMNKSKERKYIKDSAAFINDLLKRLDRARIDKSKAYKSQVETEALQIKTRLEKANEPFTELIDAHNHERKLILAEKKAKEEAEALAIKIAEDHELAILMYAEYGREQEALRLQAEADKKEYQAMVAENARIEAEQKVKDDMAKAEQDKQDAINAKAKAEQDAEQAAIKAEQDKQAAIQAEKQRQLDEQARLEREKQAREANTAHKAKINNAVLNDLIAIGIPEQQAKMVICAIAKGNVSHTKINY